MFELILCLLLTLPFFLLSTNLFLFSHLVLILCLVNKDVKCIKGLDRVEVRDTEGRNKEREKREKRKRRAKVKQEPVGVKSGGSFSG